MQQWAIGDVHGCLATLKKLLEENIGLSFDNEYYFLGDLIDRGKYSKEVLDYIINLQNSDYKIFVIKGNHEYMLLQMYDIAKKLKEKKWLQFFNKEKRILQTWQNNVGKQTLESFHIDDISNIPSTYISWLQNLPYYYELPNAILTHAGLNCNSPAPLADNINLLFGNTCFYNEKFLNHKIVIHGHHSCALENIELMIKQVDKYRYICIDNGCIYAGERNHCGHLIGLEINTKELKKQINID